MLCTGSLEQVDVSALVELHQDRGDDAKAEQPYKTEQIGADKHAHKCYQRLQADLLAYHARLQHLAHYGDDGI